MSDNPPSVPKYKREPLTAPPANLLGGSQGTPPPSNGAAAPAGPAPPSFKFDEKVDNITDAIVSASGVLHRVLVQRINFHESEAKKLRSVLAMFAGSQPATNMAPSEGSLEELLRIARTLEGQQ